MPDPTHIPSAHELRARVEAAVLKAMENFDYADMTYLNLVDSTKGQRLRWHMAYDLVESLGLTHLATLTARAQAAEGECARLREESKKASRAWDEGCNDGIAKAYRWLMKYGPAGIAEQMSATLARPASGPGEAVVLDAYDAGHLSDFGGGNVEWWQDYIRAELERAHDFYQSQVGAHTTVRAFTNEIGNAIKITIEGPTSISENTLTRTEADELRQALVEHSAPPAAGSQEG